MLCRYRFAAGTSVASPSHVQSAAIPVFDAESPDFSPAAFLKAYQVFQVAHLKHATAPKRLRDNGTVTWKDLGQIFRRLNADDKKSWCVETKGVGNEEISPADFLKSKATDARAYCSFLIQKDVSTYEDVLSRLPMKHLSWAGWSYEPALWVFFGRNPLGNANLEGRPEHTDAVGHDGTWHYQLSGRKTWQLRPGSAMLRHLAQYLPIAFLDECSDETRLRVDCLENDIIVVNTKLWLHQTSVPPQKRPSVSYARDFRFESKPVASKGTGGMTNLDGLYATGDIEVGTIVFTEIDMPDCELYRSANPNCEVVQLEDGTSAVVSIREIASGEFFCVGKSEDEASSDDDGREGEDVSS